MYTYIILDRDSINSLKKIMNIPGHFELLKQRNPYNPKETKASEVMESTALMKLPSAKETAMEQVRRAYELLLRLDFLMSFMNLEASRSELAFALLNELLESFTIAMTILSSRQKILSEVRDNGSQQPRMETVTCLKRVKLEKHQDVRRQADRKGKFVETKISCAPYNDGYHWRKYGEKKILNSIFPRCYYRCTNHDTKLKCPMKKQVQKDDHDPSLYHVTYQGKHTCNAAATPKLISNPTLQEEPASVSYESIIYKSEGRQLDSVPAKKQFVEGSDGIDNSTSDWPLDSFDIEYGELLFVPSYFGKTYIGERCEEISPQELNFLVAKISDCNF